MNSFEVIPAGQDKIIDPEKTPGEDSPQEEVGVISPEELERYQVMGQEMIDSYRKLFTTFARDVSLKFKLSDRFLIDFEKGEIHMATSWFAGKACNMEQILWATLHELSHFRDLAEDPDGILANFDYIKERTKKTAEKVIEKYIDAGAIDDKTLDRITERPAPKKDGKEQLTPIERALYKIHHGFYNALDDVYVNTLVSRKAPKFEEKRKGGAEVKKLYKEKLFAQKDYSKLPRHLQFGYKILRGEMIRDEEVVLSDDVREVFERKIEFEGKKYTVNEIIEKFIKPRSGRNTKPARRYGVIRETLELIFDELLQKDLDEWDPSKSDEGEPQEGGGGEGSGERQEGDNNKQDREEESENAKDGKPQEGEGEKESSQQEDGDKGDKNKKTKSGGKPEDFDPNPFGKANKQFEENNPDQISEEDIDKIAKFFKKKKDAKESQETDDKKILHKKNAKQAQEQLDREWAKENKVHPQTLIDFKKLEAEIAPYLDELSALWRDIVMGSSKELHRSREGYFRTGELSVPKVIEEWPKIEKRDLDDVRVMERMVDKEGLVQKPELIRVRIVGDLSGSMFQDGGEKIKILQQTFVLLLSSLREFNTYLNMNRASTKSRLEVDTEAWVFGDYPLKVKKLRSEIGQQREQVEIVEILPYLSQNMSNTYDNFALQKIHDSLSSIDKERIAKGKIMEIVFEITDGIPNSPDDTTEEIDRLDELGVIIRGFQIGRVSINTEATFNTVWNTGSKKRGEVVGRELKNLIPAVTTALKQYLKNVRL